MSRIRANMVAILNPPPGGAGYTTRKSALRFVRRGLAVFEGGDAAIRFVDQHRRVERSSSRDNLGGDFWWRLGMTGGMVQQIGSAVLPRAPKRRQGGKGI